MRWEISLLLLLIAQGCDSSPTDESGDCRRYMTSMSENGTAFSCVFERGTATLRCSSGPFLERTWEYADIDDFISEVSAPNRILARVRSSSGGALGSFARTETEYRYDTQGRLLERVRVGASPVGSETLDTARYTAWDALGRPTAGIVTGPAGSENLILRYDDASWQMEASSGESSRQDANGNPLREVFVFGTGSSEARFERAYEILAVGEICRDG
ncbi:MAG TPA: hypothetical protein VIG29_15190 [Vicinamibacteria bacterium]|jgi:hypothetical protein